VPYQSVAEFQTRTMIPVSYVTEVEAIQPGFTAAQLLSAEKLDIDGRLAKRYAVPFVAPIPEAVLAWQTRIVTWRIMMRRGYDPTDQQSIDLKEDHDAAKAEIKEAADSDVGLFDLPLRADTDASGISKGAPQGYSEQSPYVWTSEQARIGHCEDRNGRGSQ
jgi:hypothetical protein